MRYVTLLDVLGLEWSQLSTEIFTPTAGILISGEDIGMSRHNADFRLRVRHPIIGSIIFDIGAPDDHLKFELLNRLIERLDPGRYEDMEVLNSIITDEALIGTLSSSEFKRAIFDRLAEVLPDDPFVLQHRSILERRLDNSELALKYAREAVRFSQNNSAIQNTLGFALELAARKAPPSDVLIRRGYLNEATKIFNEGIRRFPLDPYNYSGLASVMRQNIESETDRNKREQLQALAISMLEEACEITDESPVIVTLLGGQWAQLGNAEEAIVKLRKSLTLEPNENRVRDLLIRLLDRAGEVSEAYELSVAGAKIDPTLWRMQRHIARLGQKVGIPKDTIRGHFEAAIRHNKSDISLLVELGAYLYQAGDIQDAEKVFLDSKSLFFAQSQQRASVFWWQDQRGKKRIFSGKVHAMSGAKATAITVPENIKVPFWKTYAEAGNIRLGTPITFQIGFNHLGPFARILLDASVATAR
jgi:tetratricopeptide (TPR) repeat protein